MELQPRSNDRLARLGSLKSSLLSGTSLLLLTLLFLFLLLKTAWLTDDAYITFRVVDNLAHGFGLRWNVAERVEAFTHPLWLFLVWGCHFVTREFYFTAITLSIAVSVLSIVLFCLRIATGFGATLAVSILCFSTAFIEYSTSGLENPLTHLLIVLYLSDFLEPRSNRRPGLRLSLLASLLLLNRMDLILLIIPSLALAVYRLGPLRNARQVLLGFSPFLLWKLFSLVYYGFLFPNTAYAKLNTGIPREELITQGFSYLGNSLSTDPLTLLVIAPMLLVSLVRKDNEARSIGLGVLLYLLYVVGIGGDFMSGRFLTGPLLCSVILISRLNLDSLDARWKGLLLVAVVGVGLSADHPPVLSDASHGSGRKEIAAFMDDRGIADERSVYYQGSGLLAPRSDPEQAFVKNAREGRRAREERMTVIQRGAIGFFGFHAGPEVHVIDIHALADPLLARLPAKKTWRVGHYGRESPGGYLQTIAAGSNRIADPDLSVYYAILSFIVRGDLFDLNRLFLIWKMNTGQFDDLVEAYLARSDRPIHKRYAGLGSSPDGFETVFEGSPVSLSDSGILIDLGALRHGTQFRATVSNYCHYEVHFVYWDVSLGIGEIPEKHSEEPGLEASSATLSGFVVERGYNRILIRPLRRGEADCQLAGIELGP